MIYTYEHVASPSAGEAASALFKIVQKNHDFEDLVTRYAPEGKPMYQIVEELAEDNEYFAEVHILQMNACLPF